MNFKFMTRDGKKKCNQIIYNINHVIFFPSDDKKNLFKNFPFNICGQKLFSK